MHVLSFVGGRLGVFLKSFFCENSFRDARKTFFLFREKKKEREKRQKKRIFFFFFSSLKTSRLSSHGVCFFFLTFCIPVYGVPLFFWGKAAKQKKNNKRVKKILVNF